MNVPISVLHMAKSQEGRKEPGSLSPLRAVKLEIPNRPLYEQEVAFYF